MHVRDVMLSFVLAAALAPAQHLVPSPAADDASFHEECSVGVAAGRATADGRPLLWKNRDAKARHNVVRRFDDGRFPYVGLCNAEPTRSVWGGANAAGFCIMNSLSRDLAAGSGRGPGNGPFMRLALQRCATVDEFEALLRETDESGRRTRANFGVIDAVGGAAFFETAHTSYVRFDAGDAEDGILVRTNFATTAGGQGGRERFARATAICFERPPAHELDHRFVLQRFCRDLTPPPSAVEGEPGTQDVRETIHRQTTVAAMVFHGVKPDEHPRATTMWAVLGQPLFSIAVPVWPAAAGVARALEGDPRSALCDAAQRLAQGFYVEPAARDEPEHDDVAGSIRWLRTGDLPRLQHELLEVEDRILAATRAALDEWRTTDAESLSDAMLAFHREQAALALAAVRAQAERLAPRERAVEPVPEPASGAKGGKTILR